MASTIDFLATLDDERFHAIYEGLSEQGFGPLDGELAKLLKFRPQAIRKLPLAQRAKKARSLMLSRKNAELAYEVLGTYLMRTRPELVTDFLDAVGIEHEDGIVEDVSAEPEAGKIEAAVATLDRSHPEEEVTLYLALSAQTWPDVAAFDELWRKRAGVATG